MGETSFLLAFLVVVLVVPWIFSGRAAASAERGPPTAESPAAGPIGPFTSRRERRLWLWLLGVLVVVYSTLGPARLLVDALRARGLLATVGFVVLLCSGAVLAALWGRTRPGRLEFGAGVGVAAIVVAAFIRTGVPERTHLFEYGLVAVLLLQALDERRRNGRQVPVPALVAVLGTVLLGWLDEGIQSQLPGRVYDLRDVGFNGLAGILTVGATRVLGWARRRDRQGWRTAA